MKIIKENKNNIKEIITALKNGAVLVCPTDTVYGLICDAGNEKAVEKIFSVKNRDKSKPLLAFVESISGAKKIAEVNEKQEEFLKKNWPGKVTVVLKAKKGLSALVRKENTVGVRIPNYKFLNLILETFGKPLAQTSANISGDSAITEINEVLKQFEAKERQPDIIIDAGNLPKSEPSTIIDLTSKNKKIIRN
ncbi:MAG: L-threonylcarbamoyladenylate synthase [Candidatus Staskawiczbacteria bacterium]|nr:L-threonylcarbamoyladenylate synthase [Candidatus Staskawiczbacteria bacterium]